MKVSNNKILNNISLKYMNLRASAGKADHRAQGSECRAKGSEHRAQDKGRRALMVL